MSVAYYIIQQNNMNMFL